jgi:RHS repeat-associated protein
VGCGHRLVRVRDNGVELASYTYDGFGRRAQKTIDGSTRTYLYGGADILEERIAGAVAKRHVHGPAVDNPLASVTTSGSLWYYLTDHLGSIVQTTGSTGQIDSTRQYGPAGNLLAGTTDSGYAFTGREWDAEVALYHYRARFYDPHLGRFISPDPAGFVDGPNLYAYVLNRPVVSRDPTGRGIVIILSLVLDVLGKAVVYTGGTIVAAAIGEKLSEFIFNKKPPHDAHDPNGAKAPGKPDDVSLHSDEKIRDTEGCRKHVLFSA